MRPQVALLSLLAAVLAGAVLLAGCGGGDDGGSTTASGDPAALIAQTFGSDKAVKSGRITVAAKGSAENAGDFDFSLTAKFDQAAADQLPKLDGTLRLTSSGGSLEAGAISTGTRGFLSVAGTAYEVPEKEFAAFTKSYLGDQKASAGAAAKRPTLGALGIQPETWLTNPRVVGEREVGGTATVHLTAGVDVEKMLADVETLVAKNDLSGRLSASELQQLGQAVTSATVDIDTGRSDQRLRRLVIHLKLETGALDLTLQYDDLDQPQEIVAPADARPLTDLTGALAQLGGGAAGGSGESDRYAECLQAAGTDLAKVQACAKYL